MSKTASLLVPVLLIASTLPVFSQLREHPDESLSGLKGVRVVVAYQGPVEEAYGLSQKQLQSAVELRLKVDDVEVLTDEEWNRAPGKPYLNINIVGTQVGSDKSPLYFYSFATDLIQQVSLSRRSSFKTDGSTWNQDYAIVVGKENLRDVTLKISDVAHDFAQSLHEANK